MHTRVIATYEGRALAFADETSGGTVWAHRNPDNNAQRAHAFYSINEAAIFMERMVATQRKTAIEYHQVPCANNAYATAEEVQAAGITAWTTPRLIQEGKMIDTTHKEPGTKVGTDMELTLTREPATQHSTPGTLTGLSVSFFSLEPPPVADPLYPGAPVCIPVGRYQVVMAESPHFGCPVPLLVGVPGRTEIELHFGNRIEDLRHTLLGHTLFLSLGCILVGMGRMDLDTITETVIACKRYLWPAIAAAAQRKEEVWITVNNPK